MSKESAKKVTKKDFQSENVTEINKKQDLKVVEEVGNQEDLATLYNKVCSVMGNVGMIEKNGYNSYHNYEYATAEDIKESLRPLCAKENLWISSEVKDYDKDRIKTSSGTYTEIELKMNFTMRCGDTGAKVTMKYIGYALDKGDKHFYKAYTGGYKYFLINNFMLSSGDDPEMDSPELDDYEEDEEDNNTPTVSGGKKPVTDRTPPKKDYSDNPVNNSPEPNKPKHNNEKLSKIRSAWKAIPELVEDAAEEYLDSIGKNGDISSITELEDEQLDDIIELIEEKESENQDENQEEKDEDEKNEDKENQDKLL